jgi:hypothetical protein
MRYYYKKPGAWTWTRYDTDSLEADVSAGRIGNDWRIHRDGESTEYLSSELIAVEAAAKNQRPQQKEEVPADIGKSAAAADKTWLIVIAVILLLKLGFALAPVTEAPSRSVVALAMLFEFGMVVGLFAFGTRVLKSEPSVRYPWIIALFIGALAWFGLVAVRLNGGPNAQLPSSSTGRPVVSADELQKRFSASVHLHTQLVQRLEKTRYASAKPSESRLLKQEDLAEARRLYAQLIDCEAAVLKLLEEAKAQGVDPSSLSTEPVLVNSETWRLSREVCVDFDRLAGLYEQNYDDWIAHPFPHNEADFKPWQRSARQLQQEIQSAQERLTEIGQAAGFGR